MTDKQLRTITTCPGLGDSVWLMQKLLNANEYFHFKLPGGEPRRGKQLFDLLPQVSASCDYREKMAYKTIDLNNIWNTRKKWAHIQEKEFFLSANKHLEQGHRIENFLPDLKTTYRIDYATSEEDALMAEMLLPDGPSYIGIYTSAYNNARHWGGWQAAQWVQLIKSLNKKDIVFVMIGAMYDVGIPGELMKEMDKLKIKYIDTIGQPLSVVIEVLKRQTYFLGFPSGLSIINETLGKNGTMMYPLHLKAMMNTWADEKRIGDGSYKGCIFPDPAKLFDWLKNVYQIFERV